MREILFRGKTVNGNDWVESMTIANGTIKRKAHDIFMEISENKWVGIKKETLSQFTGLTDINGVKIFEGDKLGDGIVVYDEHYCAFMIDFPHRSKKMYFENIVRIEITGNIHDNP